MFKRLMSSVIVSVFLLSIVFTGSSYLIAKAQGSSTAYKWDNVQIVGGGFVTGIIFNEKEKDLIYARTDMGGVYRWNPENSSWIPLTDWVSPDEWNLMGGESIATDPVDPNRVYVAAGTYTNGYTNMNGEILRSTDRGNSWERIKLPLKMGGNMEGRSMGERLMIDPNKNSTLYLGSRGFGLWRSTDFGTTWNKVESFPTAGNYKDPGSQDITGIVWIAFDKSSSTEGNITKDIYAGAADTENSIYRSTDGGNTWEAVPGQPKSGFFPHHGYLASNGMLYISYSNDVGPNGGSKGDVWKYDTKSQKWTNISPVPSSDNKDGWGYGGLAVDAQNPDTLMVATLNQWWPDANIYRSTDGGKTWSSIWTLDYSQNPPRKNKYTQDISLAPWLDWGNPKNDVDTSPKLGWWIGTLEIDPHNSDRMMYGTGATIYGSDNLTAWDKGGSVNISVKAKGIEQTAVLGLISPPSGANLLSVMGDIGGFRHEDLTKAPNMMTNPTISTATGIDYAELNPDFVVRVGNNGGNPCLAYSTDNGKTWNPGKTNIPNMTGGGKVAVSADGKTILWCPEGDQAKVSYSKDNGATWTISSGIGTRAVIASDRVNPNIFYAFYSSRFYKSTDGGASFSMTKELLLPVDGSINVKAVPGKEGDVWLTGSSGLWHSTNSGEKFAKLVSVDSSSLVGFGKAAPGKKYMSVYISGKVNFHQGIYRSDDEGTTWVRVNDDKHQYGNAGSTITGDPRVYGRVYIATNGRGIVYGDILYSIENITDSVQQGRKYKMPDTVSVILPDGTVKRSQVIWDNQPDTSKKGLQTIIGKVAEYDGTAALTLTVKAKAEAPKESINNSSKEKVIYFLTVLLLAALAALALLKGKTVMKRFKK